MRSDMSDNRTKADVVRAAKDEGELDPEVMKLPVSRWPQWARLRYAGDEPLTGPEDPAPDPGPRVDE
jgi:hypothetical protein